MSRSPRILGLAAAIMLLAASAFPVDRLTTLNGMRVEGTIMAEDEEAVVFNTKAYGQLRFMKMKLRKIERNVTPLPPEELNPPKAAATPAAAPAATPAPQPAAGGDDENPFGDAAEPAPAAAPAAGAGDDPFGSDEGFGGPAAAAAPAGGVALPADAELAPAGTANLFAEEGFGAPSGAAPAATPAPASADDNPFAPPQLGPKPKPLVPVATPAKPKFTIKPRTEPPVVKAGYDAVVYGMSEELPVEVLAKSGSAWSPAVGDTQLNTGSHVRTNATPTAKLMLRGKKDELRLPNESHIEIEKLAGDGEEVTIMLHRGSIWSEVASRANPDSFRVRTPELTAGVRGTNFRVDNVQGASRVTVFKGVVHVVANRTATYVTLKANEAAVVNANGQILDLIATPVDQQKIWDDWDNWAQEVVGGSGTLAAGFTPVGGLAQTIAQDNARWEEMNQEHMRNVAMARYDDKLREYAKAFEKFAADTGYVPESNEGWSMLKFDPGIPGWAGPYVEGPTPPLDPWKRPLAYRKVISPQSGNIFGRVYTYGQDGRDDEGVSGKDQVALIMFYSIDRIKNDPKYAPKKP